MKLNKVIYPIVLCLIFVLSGCGGSDSGGDDNPPTSGGTDDEPVVVPAPLAATLIFPEDETECNTGVIDPDDITRSTVTFEWNASENTDTYRVTLTNLNTGTSSTTNSAAVNVPITINRGTPYSWTVTSLATGTNETATSQTFRFYNEGPGIVNYAPFPAEAVAPVRGSTIVSSGNVELSWTGSDIDDDIVGYEVFLDTSNDPNTSVGTTTTETTLSDVPVTSGQVYSWKVVTTDSAGNTSTSEIFEFRVE